MNLKRIMSGMTALLLSVTCLCSTVFADESTLANTVKSVSTSNSVQTLAENSKSNSVSAATEVEDLTSLRTNDVLEPQGEYVPESKSNKNATILSMDSDSDTTINCQANSSDTVSNGKIVAANWKERQSNYGYTALGKMANGAALQQIYKVFTTEFDKVMTSTTNYTNDYTSDYGTGHKFVDININSITVTSYIANNILRAIRIDNPQYYWLANYYSFNTSGISFVMYPDYLQASTRNQCDTQITNFIKSCTSNISSSATDYDKALYVHDYIVNHTIYLNDINGEPSQAPSAHSIVGICSGTNAVCEGYALTYEIILNSIGVNTIFIGGIGNGGDHAWNASKISGKWYYTDVTWDDLDNETYAGYYAYFNVNANIFGQKHAAYDGVPKTMCNMLNFGTDHDQTYFGHNGGYITTSDFNNWYNNVSSTAIRNSISKALSNIHSYMYLYFEVDENKVFSVNTKIFSLIQDVANSKAPTSYICPTDHTYYTCGSYCSVIVSTKNLTPMSKCSATLSTTKYTYNGSAKKPTVTVKYGAKKLTAKTDYIVSYSNNVNAGTAKVKIIGTGSKFKGTINKTFTIAKASMSKCAFGLYYNGKYYITGVDKIYTGSTIKPALKVVFNKKFSLVKGTSYTVKYSSNKNIGKAKIIITGKGNFSGTITGYFNIIPKKVTGVSATTSKRNSKGAYSITIKWKKVSQATGYQIFYRTSKTAKNKVVTLKNASTLKKTISGIKANNFYYNVRAYKKVGNTYYYGY